MERIIVYTGEGVMAKRKTIDLDLAKKLYWEDNWSTSKIASLMNVHLQTIINKFKENGIPIKKQGSYSIEIDPLDIKKVYEETLSTQETAKHFNISVASVRKLLKISGVQLKRSGGEHKRKKIDGNLVVDLYVNKMYTIAECSKYFRVSDSVIRRILKEHSVTIRKSTTNRRKDIDNSYVHKLYWEQHKSISYIAKKLSCGETTVRKRLKDIGSGIRSVKDGARIWRKSDQIDDKELVYLYDECGWSCGRIAVHFNKSSDFVRQRFIAINKPRRKNTGKHNGSWNGGVTDLRNSIRTCARYKDWRTSVFAANEYRSVISKENRNLNCHHIYPFHIILKSAKTKNTILPPEYKTLAIVSDGRFYDYDNGLCITKKEHDLIEDTPNDSHPWWKIWKCFPNFALNNSNFSHDDFALFDRNGKIHSSGYNLVVGSHRSIKTIVRYEHYLGTVVSPRLIMVARRGSIVIGVSIFGKGANKNIGDNTWELTRLCVPFYVHKPFSCKFLTDCIGYIKDNFPHIKRLVAFADKSVGHDGGVYRISGWEKAGKTNKDYAYFDPNKLCLRHKSCCRRIKNVDMTEKQIAESRGMIKIPTDIKYRYVYDLTK